MRERIDVMLRDDAKFAATEAGIPQKPKGSVGRDRDYPDFVWLMWPELRDIFGSHTAVERELRRGGWWSYIRHELRRLRPELPVLPKRPPRRQHYEYMRDTYMITDEALRCQAEVHTEVSAGQAQDAGNFDPEGGGSFTRPDITGTMEGDGKVIKPLYTCL